MPFFSVIIPSYNRAEFLTHTIASVLKQTFTDLEVILVDDGSTDHTQELVYAMASKDARIRYIYQENKERAAARNLGIKNAKGSFAVFLDSDDLFLDHHLDTLHHYIQSNPTIYFFASKHQLKTETKLKQNASLSSKKQGLYSYQDFLMGNFLCCNFCVSLKNESLQLFNEDRKLTRCEDWYFIIHNTVDTPLLLIDEYTVCMLDHAERSMNKDFQRIIESRLALTDLLKQNLLTSPRDIHLLEANSYFFCAVQARLDGNKIQALNYLFKSILKLGVTKSIILLFLKIIFK